METSRHQNLPINLIEPNDGQLSHIDEGTGKEIGLPKNPRWIRDAQYEALKRSISDSPEFLDARTLLVYPMDNGKYIVIGGNMRLKACTELGFKELPCYVFPKETPVEKLREYTIKDNNQQGQWDWDILADDWEQDELEAWGMEIDNFSSSVDFDRVEDISDDNYETPKTKMLECPKCHHKDFAIHFKSFEAEVNAEVSAEEQEILGEEENDDDLQKE